MPPKRKREEPQRQRVHVIADDYRDLMNRLATAVNSWDDFQREERIYNTVEPYLTHEMRYNATRRFADLETVLANTYHTSRRPTSAEILRARATYQGQPIPTTRNGWARPFAPHAGGFLEDSSPTPSQPPSDSSDEDPFYVPP